MLKKPAFAVLITTIAVVLYNILPRFTDSFILPGIILITSPFLMGWMVYTILRFGKYNGKELNDKEEWGYQDKRNDELGMF